MNSYIQQRPSPAFQTSNLQGQPLDGSLKLPFQRVLRAKEEKQSLILQEKGRTLVIPYEEILYLKASHIYVEIVCNMRRKVVQRKSLTDLLKQLHSDEFIQTHRSFAVNKSQVRTWDNSTVYMQNATIPISRSRKKMIHGLLEIE